MSLDSGLTPNTTYYYRVRAYNAAGNSDYSNEANATTMKGVETIIIRLYIDKTTYYVNDTLKTMDVAPIIKESRTLLPIRYVAEALGADVQWDAVERKVTIIFKGTTIELWIDKNSAKVNGEYKLIDATNPKVTPIIIPPGRTMLPIRFIAENLGCLVEWDNTLREVKITYPAP
jgi:titin